MFSLSLHLLKNFSQLISQNFFQFSVILFHLFCKFIYFSLAKNMQRPIQQRHPSLSLMLFDLLLASPLMNPATPSKPFKKIVCSFTLKLEIRKYYILSKTSQTCINVSFCFGRRGFDELFCVLTGDLAVDFLINTTLTTVVERCWTVSLFSVTLRRNSISVGFEKRRVRIVGASQRQTKVKYNKSSRCSTFDCWMVWIKSFEKET